MSVYSFVIFDNFTKSWSPLNVVPGGSLVKNLFSHKFGQRHKFASLQLKSAAYYYVSGLHHFILPSPSYHHANKEKAKATAHYHESEDVHC